MTSKVTCRTVARGNRRVSIQFEVHRDTWRARRAQEGREKARGAIRDQDVGGDSTATRRRRGGAQRVPSCQVDRVRGQLTYCDAQETGETGVGEEKENPSPSRVLHPVPRIANTVPHAIDCVRSRPRTLLDRRDSITNSRGASIGQITQLASRSEECDHSRRLPSKRDTRRHLHACWRLMRASPARRDRL